MGEAVPPSGLGVAGRGMFTGGACVVVPAVVDVAPSASACTAQVARPGEPAMIEISIGAATVRLRGAVDARSLATVLKALKVLA